MKQNITIRLRIVFILCTIFSHQLLNAQQQYSMWAGETIRASTESGWFATSHSVYRGIEHGNAIDEIVPDYVFTSEHHTIKNIASKKKANPFSAEIVLILLDDGTVLSSRFDHNDIQDNRVYRTDTLGKIGSAGSETWQKVIGDALYVLTTSKVFVSHDFGATWNIDTAGLNGAHIWDIDMDTTTTKVYAATNQGLFAKDTLVGTHWSQVSSFTGTTDVYKIFIDRKNRILVAGNGSGLWISKNSGSTWQADTSGLGGGGTLTVFGDDVYGNLYGANNSPGKLYRSNNGTGNWQAIDAGIVSLSVNTPVYNCISGDSSLLAGTSFGIFRSGDKGNTWIKNDSGVFTENIYSFTKLSNNKLFASTNLGLYAQKAGDTIWSKSYPANGYSSGVLVFSDNNNNLYALDNSIVHNNNSATPVVKSTNKGSTWSIDTAGLSQIDKGIFYIDKNGNQHIGTTLYGNNFICKMWQRTSSGAWTIDTVGFPSKNYSFVSSITSTDGYVYVSGSLSSKKVLREPLTGGAWTIDTAGIPSYINYFSIMAPGYKGDVLGGAGYYLFLKHKNLWSSITLPVVSTLVTAVAADTAGNIFVALANSDNLGKGVWHTNDGGTTWKSSGLDSIYIKQLIAYNDTVYALTSSNGLFAISLKTSCAKPSKLSAKNITTTTADLSWKAVTGAAKYKLQYKPTSSSTWTSVSTTNASYHLTGLSAGTMYDWKVQTYCTPDGSNKSAFNNSSFTTAISLTNDVAAADNTIRIYPNPTKGIFTIQLNSLFVGEATITVDDAYGKQILVFNKNVSKYENEFNIDASKFAGGVYFITIQQGDKKIVQKLVKK